MHPRLSVSSSFSSSWHFQRPAAQTSCQTLDLVFTQTVRLRKNLTSNWNRHFRSCGSKQNKDVHGQPSTTKNLNWCCWQGQKGCYACQTTGGMSVFSPPQEITQRTLQWWCSCPILFQEYPNLNALVVIKKLFSLRSNLRKIKSISVCTLHTAQRQTEHHKKNNTCHKSYFWYCPLALTMHAAGVWTFHSFLTRRNMFFWFHIWMQWFCVTAHSCALAALLSLNLWCGATKL